MSSIAKGYESIVGWKQNTATWGSGLAALVGSGDGLELISESLTADSQLIENESVSGQATQLPGAAGNIFHNGDIVVPGYYQGCETLIAQVMGTAAAPAQQGGTAAYLHVYTLAENHEGKEGTLVLDHSFVVREYPHVKLSRWEGNCENGKRLDMTFGGVPFTLNLNRGTADDDYFVVDVEPAAGALTVANATLPSTTPIGQLTVTVTDANASITELIATVVATDERGNLITIVYTLSTMGLTETFPQRISGVTSVTLSGITGTVTAGVDKIKLGYVPGINTAATVSSISLPSNRNFILFDQMEVLINEQSGGALTAATAAAQNDSQYVSAFMFSVDLNMTTDDVTTQHGYRVDEPIKDNFIKVTGGLTFSKLMGGSGAGARSNIELIRKYLMKTKMKMRVKWTGPAAATGYPYSLTLYFNNVQFTSGSPNIGGAQRVGFDLQFQAQRALTAPTGFDAAYTKALTVELINQRTTIAMS